MNSKKNAETLKSLLVFHFGRYYRDWNGQNLNDDRNIFVGMYDQLAEAIDDMAKVKNNFVWIAFRQKMKEQETEMCEIVKRFTGSYPVYGTNSIYDPATI